MKYIRVNLVHLVAITSVLTCVSGARILCVFPASSRSHIIAYQPLTRELAIRGHQLTVISSFALEKPVVNYTDIVLPEVHHGLEKTIYDIRYPSIIKSVYMYWQLLNKRCEYFLKNSRVQELIRSDQQFDLIIFETLFYECFLGFSHKFRAQSIGIFANRGTHWMWDIVGNTSPYAYVPSLDLAYSDHMSFMERTINTLSITAFNVIRTLVLLPQYDKIMRKYFHDPKMPYVKDLENNISMLLLTNYDQLDYPKPVVPAIINVGAMHINLSRKLPKDLQTFLDNAKHGVVYFSLGSNIKSNFIPESLQKVFLNAFSKLKQHVLWAYDRETVLNVPTNVRMGKWLPQADILAHPNVKVFLSHGGYMGMMETTYCGVPYISIPIVVDQFWNARLAQEMGFGVTLELNNVTTDSLLWAIDTAISQPSYRAAAQTMSSRLREQLQTPLEKAVYWTEYVLRHKGIPHLRVAAKDLFWYQYYMLDTIALLFVPLLLYYLLKHFLGYLVDKIVSKLE